MSVLNLRFSKYLANVNDTSREHCTNDGLPHGQCGHMSRANGGALDIYIYISIFYFFIILFFNGQDFGHEGTLMFLIYKMNTSHLKKKMAWRQCRSAWSTVNFRGKMEKRVLSRSAKRKRKNEKDTKDTALVGLQQIPSITTFFNKKREQADDAEFFIF